MPKKLIILRHGEKPTGAQSSFHLSDVGVRRSHALAKQYLGRDASHSLFDKDDEPAAFFANTLHCVETISPSAESWGKPVIAYTVVPPPKGGEAKDLALDFRTQQVAADLLRHKWKGKTLVVAWEHKHIASALLDKKHAESVTLRQLLGLDAFADVPHTWPGQTFDYFWIITFGRSGRPKHFEKIRQDFTGSYRDLPHNDWGKPEKAAGSKRRHA